MYSRVIVLVCLMAAGALSGELMAQPSADTAYLRIVREARLIFTGVVVAHDSGGLLVRAEEVVRTPKAIGNFRQRLLTVVTSNLQGADPGQRAAFYAHGLRLGTGMRVRELLREPLSGPNPLVALVARLAVADSVNANVALRDRTLQADAIVIGSVDSLQSISLTPSQLRQRSEHSPNWRRAWITVTGTFVARDSALRGQTLRVLSAPGQSIALTPTPLLTTGDRRILFLRRAGRLAPYNRVGIDTAGVYFAFYPDNTRPASDSARLVFVLK